MRDYDFIGNDDPECIIAHVLDNAQSAADVMKALDNLGFQVLPKNTDAPGLSLCFKEE
jgi:hypothetical protein